MSFLGFGGGQVTELQRQLNETKQELERVQKNLHHEQKNTLELQTSLNKHRKFVENLYNRLFKFFPQGKQAQKFLKEDSKLDALESVTAHLDNLIGHLYDFKYFDKEDDIFGKEGMKRVKNKLKDAAVLSEDVKTLQSDFTKHTDFHAKLSFGTYVKQVWEKYKELEQLRIELETLTPLTVNVSGPKALLLYAKYVDSQIDRMYDLLHSMNFIQIERKSFSGLKPSAILEAISEVKKVYKDYSEIKQRTASIPVQPHEFDQQSQLLDKLLIQYKALDQFASGLQKELKIQNLDTLFNMIVKLAQETKKIVLQVQAQNTTKAELVSSLQALHSTINGKTAKTFRLQNDLFKCGEYLDNVINQLANLTSKKTV